MGQRGAFQNRYTLANSNSGALQDIYENPLFEKRVKAPKEEHLQKGQEGKIIVFCGLYPEKANGTSTNWLFAIAATAVLVWVMMIGMTAYFHHRREF